MKIDGRSFSPKVLGKIIYAAAHQPSFQQSAQSLNILGEISISARHVGNLTTRIGGELEREFNARMEAYFNGPLRERRSTKPLLPIYLACVGGDGGRMLTRDEGGGLGVTNAHWRETKNALFMRMSGVQFDYDPHPALPDCFRDPQFMKKLLSGVSDAIPREEGTEKSDLRTWRPERLYRTCLSSLCDSDTFGRMMEVEADARGFYKAAKRAYVGDGLGYNWTIQKRHFPTFTPILDLPHALERAYEAARSVRSGESARWEVYGNWARACWEGRVDDMLSEMRQEQESLGLPPEDCDAKDPRQVLSEAITYFTNNADKMDYPRYRREGLPQCSSYVESLVKEVNYRVKGTEKFWDDGASGEAILRVRAAALCDDGRLDEHMATRPGSPFHPNVTKATAEGVAI